MLTLRDYQQEAVDFLLPKRRGFIVSPAGSGKSLIGAVAIGRRAWAGCKITWLCNTREQREQAESAISGVEGPDDVRFEVACVAAQPDTSDSDIIVFDEAHHSPAGTWANLIGRAKSDAIIWGFSATPWAENDVERDEFLEETFQNFFYIERERVENSGHLIKGKVYVHDLDVPGCWDAEIDAKVMVEVERRFRRYPVLRDVPKIMGLNSKLGAIARRIEVRMGPEGLIKASRGLVTQAEAEAEGCAELINEAVTITEQRDALTKQEHKKRAQWTLSQEFLQANEARNAKAVQIATEESAKGESVLVLVNSIEHGEKLAARIPGAVLAHSKMGAAKRRQTIADFRAGVLQVLVATQLADEGLDVPIASRLVLVSGGRSAGKLEQRAGRVLRPYEGKNGGVIHDFQDRGILFAYQQAKARFRVYDRLGYSPEIVSYEQKAA